MARFRLLQITDLHISVPPDDPVGLSWWMSVQAIYPSRAREPVLSAAAEFVIERQYDIDVVIVSGDLADDGLRLNLEAAKAFLEEPAVQQGAAYTDDGFPTISELNPGRALFVLPGNHDRFDGVRRKHGGVEFDSVFSTYWDKGLNGVRSLVVGKTDGSLALVAADFCCRANSMPINANLGEGEVYADTLAELETETVRLRTENPGIAILWVFHFPPIIDMEADLQLKAAKDAVAKAIALDVSYILAGHLHRNQKIEYTGVEIICTGSAASELRDFHGNWIRIFEIENGPTGLSEPTHETYRYDPRHAAFVPSRATRFVTSTNTI